MDEPFTFGVEEEFLTVDRSTLDLRPRADGVLTQARPELGDAVQAELNLAQIEVATPICHTLVEVEGALVRTRAALADAAAAHGSAIAATGTHPSTEWLGQPVTPTARFLDLEELFQQLAREQLICGCHVHVAVEDPDERIAVMDRVRSWVPTLLAFSANSPFWQGVDTGYASYRTQIFDRWPTAGPPPVCHDRAGYEGVVAELVEVGMVADASYLYWHVRPAVRYPTIELRVADVTLTAEEASTLAGLFRALVRSCHRSLRGPTPELPRHEVVRAATWRACRYGLGESLVDLEARRLVPAADALRALLARVRADCDEDEWHELAERVERVLARGNGARRQRAARREGGTFRAVTEMILAETLAGVGVPDPPLVR